MPATLSEAFGQNYDTYPPSDLQQKRKKKNAKGKTYGQEVPQRKFTSPEPKKELNLTIGGYPEEDDQYLSISTNNEYGPTDYNIKPKDVQEYVHQMKQNYVDDNTNANNTLIAARSIAENDYIADVSAIDAERDSALVASKAVSESAIVARNAATAARNAAITSPLEGMRAYITAPTIPATTGGGIGIPSGITTVYNGSTWVCTTTVATWNSNTCTAQSVSAYSTCLWSGNALSVTSNTGSSALVTLTARIFASGSQYFFAAVKPGTGGATDGFSISTQQSSGASTHCIGGTWLFTSLPAATNTFTVQMRNNGGVSMFIDQCHITVTGIA
jgi:hypothetical protein